MTKVDAVAKVVHLEQHEPVEYDYLVICCGVTANYFGIPGAAETRSRSTPASGAIATRDRVLTAIENANQGVDGAPEPTIVVVGGGATGVEMAGALAELRNAAVPIAYRQLDPARVRIILVEMADHVLAPFHPKLRSYAAKQLRKRGVDLRLSTSLKEVRPDAVVVERPDGEAETIECAVVVWATGITAGPIVGDWGLPTGRGGRIEVGADLRVAGSPRGVRGRRRRAGPGEPGPGRPAGDPGRQARGRADPAVARRRPDASPSSTSTRAPWPRSGAATPWSSSRSACGCAD